MRPEHWVFTIPLRLRLLFRWAQTHCGPVQGRFRKDRHRRQGGVVERQRERRWPTGPEAHNIEIVTSQQS